MAYSYYITEQLDNQSVNTQKRTMRKGIILLILIISTVKIFAQPVKQETKQKTFESTIDGEVVMGIITEAGDTLYVKVLKDVSVVAKKRFSSSKERRHYYAMKANVTKVFPYAVKAVQVLKDLEAVTKDLNRRNRKKHIKALQDELELEFKGPLKTLTQSQGRVLIKMVERELGTPMYDIVKDLKGGFSASYWNTFSRMYDIDIKEGYNPKEDPILEIILSGVNISHEIAGH